MWLDEYAPVLALADTTRPILLIVFIVALFGLAALGVWVGRKRMSAQNARAIAKDAGIAKGDVRGGDGTASADWFKSVQEEVDDSPRQSWADVLSLQGVATTTDEGVSPFASTAATYDPAPEQPVYEAAPEQPVYEAAPEQPVYEAAPEQPAYEQPAYEQPAYEQPAYEQPAYEAAPEQPIYEQPVYGATPQQPAYEAPATQPAYAPHMPQATAPGGEYAAYFGATTPPPPPPPSGPLNIWSSDED